MVHEISAKAALENPQRIEPALLEFAPPRVADLTAEISATSARLAGALHPRAAASLAQLVRIMNAYYTNLIEGHNTRPADIVRALAGEFASDESRRNLQEEAAAHVRVQARVDELAAEGSLPNPTSGEFIRWVHGEFYQNVPRAMLIVRGRDGEYEMKPGKYRTTIAQVVAVGRHQPPSSPYVGNFMRYFSERYQLSDLGIAMRIVSIPAAHHRFNYIHPFPDGNGRVSRLMSHAMAHASGIGAHGLWSISRGLARGLGDRTQYKRMMDFADSPREKNLDGRGNLSLRALIDFTAWFLEVCLDQLCFMSELFDLDTLSKRLRVWAERDDRFKPEVGRLLEEAAIRGEFDRGEAARITGLPERTARRVLNEACAAGLLASESPKGPVSLRFPPDDAEAMFPRLFQTAS
ncbi:MAG TPA: Fic family protein [Candidatus Cybelea sp.]|jgi:Fic family protein